MLYIVTYATHSERYFDILKQSYPNIIVLGFGTKWNGFYDKVKATVDFCKDKNDDDLILFVDGFDSVVLHTDDIINKYKSFNVPIVMSLDINTKSTSILSKYKHDVIFNTCNSLSLNSGLYIGTPKAIIYFWQNIKPGDDDQIYATKQCNNLGDNFIKIDTENKLFFNYFKPDNIQLNYESQSNIRKLKIGKEFPNIISAPAYGNINDILVNLGYNNISKKIIDDNEKKIHFEKRFYFNKNFRLDFIIFLFIILIMYFIPNKINGLFISILLFYELLHYQLFIKHINKKFIIKIIYLLIDLFELFIIYTIFDLIINNRNKCNKQKLLLLNIYSFFIIIIYFIFKKDIFSIIKEYFLDIKDNVSFIDQNYYLLGYNSSYINKNKKNSNIIFLLVILCINLYCLNNNI
jgi:hypothetical protein